MPRRRSAAVGALTALLLGCATSVAHARPDTLVAPAAVPELSWADCGTTTQGTGAGVECATAALPLDYDLPDGEQVNIAVARVPAKDPAQRIGSLFFNFGGPGAQSVDYLQEAGAGFFATLNQRFDIVGFDPRGVGQSTPSIDCRADQERQGIHSLPFPTPLRLDVGVVVAKAQSYVDSCLANNGGILQHVSTANVARDMDVLRAAVGDDRLSYLGFSYGTFLGSTYAALFPDRYRVLALDGPVDAERYMHDPVSYNAEQTAAFEIAFARFTQACAAEQTACLRFGGADPYAAYDRLVAAADTTPIPAAGYTSDPRPVTGDDIRAATLSLLYAKQLWGALALALSQAANGDGSIFRLVVDQFVYGRQDDGTFDPSTDRLFAIGAAEQQFPQGDLQVYLDRGVQSWASFPHFSLGGGYSEISHGLWPARDEDAFGGPFTIPASSPTPLVVATTYDPATPYPGGLGLVAQLGNARLLTMDGDGHIAYGGNSACVDRAMESYLIDGTLPTQGTVCLQHVPFTPPGPAPAAVGIDSGVRLTGTDAVGAVVVARR
jgi:pimeloyl-ACP methyl ester carboxylesterase